ncbi:hypothetical protein Tco_1125568 [Tanacetum coccineum]|uniref:Uncharacterized protein n=1 Tax=Tanacetum coccineum TaxID=301880 RepID=A0ABQ5JCC3_9ASTR
MLDHSSRREGGGRKGSGHPSEPQPPPSTAQSIHEEPIHNVVSLSHQKTQTPRKALNQVTELPQTSEPIPNVADEAVYEEWDNRVEMDITTASLDTAHASGNITKTQSTAIPNVHLLKELVQVVVPGAKKPREVPLLKLDRVLALEINLRQTKKVYGAAYTKLIMKVKKLEKTGRMIEEIDQDAGVTLVTSLHIARDNLKIRLESFSVQLNQLDCWSIESCSTADTVQEVNKDKGDKTVLELTTGSAKRDAEVELDHEGSKKQKTRSSRVSSRTTRKRGNIIATRGFTIDDDGSSSGSLDLKPYRSNSQS